MNKTILDKIDTLIEEFNARNLIPGYEGYQEGKKTNDQLLGMVLGPEGVKGANENYKLKDAYTKSSVLKSAGLGAGLGALTAYGDIQDTDDIFDNLPSDGLDAYRGIVDNPDDYNKDMVYDVKNTLNVKDHPWEHAGKHTLLGGTLVAGATPAISYGLGKLSSTIKNKLANQKK